MLICVNSITTYQYRFIPSFSLTPKSTCDHKSFIEPWAALVSFLLRTETIISLILQATLLAASLLPRRRSRFLLLERTLTKILVSWSRSRRRCLEHRAKMSDDLLEMLMHYQCNGNRQLYGTCDK